MSAFFSESDVPDNFNFDHGVERLTKLKKWFELCEIVAGIDTEKTTPFMASAELAFALDTSIEKIIRMRSGDLLPDRTLAAKIALLTSFDIDRIFADITGLDSSLVRSQAD